MTSWSQTCLSNFSSTTLTKIKDVKTVFSREVKSHGSLKVLMVRLPNALIVIFIKMLPSVRSFRMGCFQIVVGTCSRFDFLWTHFNFGWQMKRATDDWWHVRIITGATCSLCSLPQHDIVQKWLRWFFDGPLMIPRCFRWFKDGSDGPDRWWFEIVQKRFRRVLLGSVEFQTYCMLPCQKRKSYYCMLLPLITFNNFILND